MTIADAALGYARRGWRVVPILAGSKRPTISTWVELATTDPERIAEWWPATANHGVGIVTGKASGIWVLDVDDLDALFALEAAHGELPPTLTSITGSGGYHLIYRWPDSGEVRNDAGRRLGPGLDVRGEGGQIVAPPTVHPNGLPYAWDPSAPDDVTDAPSWLLELVMGDPTPLREREQRRELARSDRPGDRWAAATSWAELLERDGWTLHHVDRDGEHHWTRPGKQTREGTSATTGYMGSDVLKVFTSSLRSLGLAEEETYTKLGYLAATRYGGDHGAAASFLASQGWSSVDTADLDALIDRTGSNEAVRLVAETLQAAPPPAEAESGGDLAWQVIDLRPYVDGTHEPVLPTLVLRDDGVGLVYPGRVHSLAGEPGGGKTWVALWAVATVLADDDDATALFVDYEDNPVSLVGRLRALGVPDATITDRVTYVRPHGPLIERSGRVNGPALAWLDAQRPTIAVIDSVGESIAAEGLNPSSDEEVARWYQLLPRSLARNRAAVVLIDHVAKDRESRGNWAIGSQRKLAAIDGAAYTLQVRTAPTRDKDGHLVITCAKDRHGTHQQGHQVGTVDILNGDHGAVTVRLTAPPTTFRPTTLMERVSRYLEELPTANTRAICADVDGTDKHIRTALKVLEVEGYIAVEKGARNTQMWRSVEPFRAPKDDVIHSLTTTAATAAAPRRLDSAAVDSATAATAAAPRRLDSAAVDWGAQDDRGGAAAPYVVGAGDPPRSTPHRGEVEGLTAAASDDGADTPSTPRPRRLERGDPDPLATPFD